MAEGLLNALGKDRFEAHSAGTEARGVHPFAIQAMGEIGIDISTQGSKTIDRYLNEPFDIVITVCSDAEEACPTFPHARERRHWSFADPSLAMGDDEQRFAFFARVRDAIGERIRKDLIER